MGRMRRVKSLCGRVDISEWQYVVNGDGRRRRKNDSTPEQKKKTKYPLNTPLRWGEVTVGYVEMPLAGRADDWCGVTAH